MCIQLINFAFSLFFTRSHRFNREPAGSVQLATQASDWLPVTTRRLARQPEEFWTGERLSLALELRHPSTIRHCEHSAIWIHSSIGESTHFKSSALITAHRLHWSRSDLWIYSFVSPQCAERLRFSSERRSEIPVRTPQPKCDVWLVLFVYYPTVFYMLFDSSLSSVSR